MKKPVEHKCVGCGNVLLLPGREALEALPRMPK
jgi:hypothetical protein